MLTRLCMTCGQPYYATPPPDVCRVCKGAAMIVERPVAVVALGEARVRELEADTDRAELWADPPDAEEPDIDIHERYAALEKHAERQHAELVRETQERVELEDKHGRALSRIRQLEDVLHQLRNCISDEVWNMLFEKDWREPSTEFVSFAELLGLHRPGPKLVAGGEQAVGERSGWRFLPAGSRPPSDGEPEEG